MVATANGRALWSTGGLKSGYFQQTVRFDPKIHGNKVDIAVEAPDKKTAWRMCVSCPTLGKQCTDANIKRVNLRAYQYITSGAPWWSCTRVTDVYIDGKKPDLMSSKVAVTVGDHVVTWKGGYCSCGGICPIAAPPLSAEIRLSLEGSYKRLSIPLGAYRSDGRREITISN